MVLRFTPALLLLTTTTTLCYVNGFSIHRPLQTSTSTASRVVLEASAELWLDLRRTSLTPTTALARLEDDLEQVGIVDRILVSKQEDKGDDARVVVVGSYAGCTAQGLDGIVVDMPESGILNDPFPAMNTVSTGGWVLVEFEAGDPRKRQEGVSSLIQLLAAGASSELSLGEKAEESSGESGGLAWICETKADILHAGTAMRSLETVESSSGGILLSAASSSSDSSLKCALMLPFDEIVWQTALLMFRAQEEPVLD